MEPNMPINPVQFAHSVCGEFLRYLFSAFPLSDPDLRDQFRRLLDRPSSLDTPLVQGPFVSLSEAFAKGDPVQQLADKGTLHHAMPGLIGYPSMYLHQQKVLEAVKDGRHVLVSTGTGSGKTESFLYPIIDDLLRQRDKGVREGVTAILVYPMNALANDQLDCLRDVLGGTGITFGQWVGTTPGTEGDVGVERFQGSSRPAYLEARRKRREEAQAEDRAVRPLAPPEECCSEEDIRERKPRILLTNYRQLEVLSTRLPEVSLFAEAPLRYLVFDEAHTYSGATGAEVACLIRRLRALAGKKPDEVVCVGTSATLADPTGTDAAARRFASRFFGVDPERVNLVGESYVSREWPKGRYKPVAPHGDGMDRLGRVLAAVTDPADVPAVKAVVEELTGQLFDPGDDWAGALFDQLVTNEFVFQATEVLKRPGKLDEAAWHTSQRLRPAGSLRAGRRRPNCSRTSSSGRRPGKTATACCGRRSTSSSGAWTRWSRPSPAPPTRPPSTWPCHSLTPRTGTPAGGTTPSSPCWSAGVAASTSWSGGIRGWSCRGGRGANSRGSTTGTRSKTGVRRTPFGRPPRLRPAPVWSSPTDCWKRPIAARPPVPSGGQGDISAASAGPCTATRRPDAWRTGAATPSRRCRWSRSGTA
jgi:hypothetical protein